MRTTSLFVRLLPAYAFVGIAALFGAGLYGMRTVSSVSLDRASKQLETQTRLAGFAVENAVRRRAHGEVHAFCQGQRPTSRFHVTVMLPDGQVIGDSLESVENIGSQANRPEIADALTRGSGTSSRFDPTTRVEMQYHAVIVGGRDEPIAVVRVGLPQSAMGQAIGGFAAVLAAGTLLVLALSAAMSAYVARRVRSGVDRISEAAEQSMGEGRAIAAGDEIPKEFAPLAQSVEEMKAHLWSAATDADRQHHQQEAVLASMVECVLAVDADGRLITLNQAARDLFSIDQPGNEGRPVYEVLRNPDVQQLITDTLERSEMIEREFSIHVPDPRVVQARGTMLRSNQHDNSGVVVVLHDVTRLRRLEEARREFVANVSHELRTPITSITGFVETLLDGAIDEPNQAQHFLGIVMRQTDRLNAIIDDLLTLSRLEQGGLARSGLLAHSEVRDVLKAVAQVCSQEAEAKGVRLVIDCNEHEPVLMHRELVEQAVANLVQNAIKYSEPAGRIVLRGFRSGQFAVITVADEGTGIEAQHLPRLFERFYRVDRARSRELGGTGLGLAIVKHIAQAHGGSVDVESAPGVGSTFELRIPAGPG